MINKRHYFKETKKRVKQLRDLTKELKTLCETIDDKPMVSIDDTDVKVVADEEKIDMLMLYAAAIKEGYQQLKREAKFAL